MRGLWCAALATALAALLGVGGFTVDCDRDYADCDKELGKLTEENDEIAVPPEPVRPGLSQNKTESLKESLLTSDVTPKENLMAKGRFLNISLDDVPSFANTINNQTVPNPVKKSVDLSDVSMDDDEFVFPPHKTKGDDGRILNKFLPIFDEADQKESERSLEDSRPCVENGVAYKVGEKMDRGCEETCECGTPGTWRCHSRCQTPYIRQGKSIPDPLCYESPVDDCCSIVACSANSDQDIKSQGGARTEYKKMCRYGNSSYAVDESWDIGCDQRCICGADGVVTCKPRCPTLVASEHCINVQDPHDSCCQVQICDVTHDAHEHQEALATTMQDRMDNVFEDVLMATTTKVTTKKTGKYEPVLQVKVLNNNTVMLSLAQPNSSAQPFHLQISSDGGLTLENIQLSNGNMINNLEVDTDYILKVKETGKTFQFKIPDRKKEDVKPYDKEIEETETEKFETTTVAYKSVVNTTVGCVSEGVTYRVGEEFRIGCSELCECVGPNEKECAALDCPSHVGLELVSPTCVRWAPDPPDWVPAPPACCPSKMRCLSDGSCDYQGHKIPNWSEVPESLTGCELRCFCESGNLDCQNICSPLPPLPPQTLRCQPSYKPGAVNISEEDCCKTWGCVPIGQPSGIAPATQTQNPPFLPTVPPSTRPEIHFPTEDDLGQFGNNDVNRLLPPAPPKGPPQFQIPSLIPPTAVETIDNSRLSLRNLVADTPTSVKILFELSPVLVGLRGSVDLRYTDKDDDDISRWYSQVFAPADEVLTTARLEFRLTGLKPSTMYKLRGKLYLHNLALEPVSNVYTVRTLDEPQLEEKRRSVETGLRVQNVNSSAAQVSWRHFTEEELQYIDGIQVRYRPIEQPIYSMTELLHHWRVSVELTDLRPGTNYEASLVLVAPSRSPVELFDTKTVNFTTPHYYDMYNFSVIVEARRVGAESVEVSWRGVPAPPERYVRVYRAAHSCDGNMAASHVIREHDAFKLADRDQPPIILLNGLRSDSKCRVWLELFLTNGKVKISNVLDITTKLEDFENSVDNEVQASSVAGSRSGNANGDYYSALVVVGVVAALGTLTSLLLLLVVMRRHRPHSVSITTVPSAPRAPSLPPYDNPAYKLELQQETMDL